MIPCPPGVRDPFNTSLDPGKRTIYLGHIPKECKPKDILDVVRGGPIERLGIVPGKECAFLKFIYADDALEFYSRNVGKFRVLDARVTVGWGKENAEHTPFLLRAVYAGATRNVFIGRLTEDVSAAQLAEELKEFGPIEKVDVLLQKKIAFVHFSGILSAVSCVKKLRERRDGVWTQRNINYGIDRCTVGWTPSINYRPRSPRGEKRRRDSPPRRSPPRHPSSRHSSSRHSPRHSPRRSDREAWYRERDRTRGDGPRDHAWNREREPIFRERERMGERDREYFPDRKYLEQRREHERYQDLPQDSYDGIVHKPPSSYPTSPSLPVQRENMERHMEISPPKGGLTEQERKELQELRELRQMRDALTEEELRELRDLRKQRERGELPGFGEPRRDFRDPRDLMRREMEIMPRDPRPRDPMMRNPVIPELPPPGPVLNIRDPLETMHDPTRRIIYLGRLPKDCNAKEILDLVKEGPLQSIGLLRPKDCAFIKFMYVDDAIHFFQRASSRTFTLNGTVLKVAWGKETAPLDQNLLNIIRAGATRNVFIGRINEDISAGELVTQLSHFGNIEKVDVLTNKKIAFIHFYDLMYAVKCVSALRSSKDSKWAHRTINYGPDRCDEFRKLRKNNSRPR